MRIRVIQCDDESHDLPWVLAKDCSHWSMTCPRARKARKPAHKLTRDEPGYVVAVSGIPEEGYDYPGDPTEDALALREKRYMGHWCPGPELGHTRCDVPRGLSKIDEAGLGSIFVAPPPGVLVSCETGCGFVAAV